MNYLSSPLASHSGVAHMSDHPSCPSSDHTGGHIRSYPAPTNVQYDSASDSRPFTHPPTHKADTKCRPLYTYVDTPSVLTRPAGEPLSAKSPSYMLHTFLNPDACRSFPGVVPPPTDLASIHALRRQPCSFPSLTAITRGLPGPWSQAPDFFCPCPHVDVLASDYSAMCGIY
jgi:hypothetical protein